MEPHYLYTSVTETQRKNECLVLKSNSKFCEHTLLKTERYLLSLEKSETSKQSLHGKVPSSKQSQSNK